MVEKWTKEYVMSLIEEYKIEDKKGKYPNKTDRYKELFYDNEEKGLRSEQARIFECSDCGKLFGYFDLEDWCCDFESDDYICSCCYEDEMGDDL